VAEEASKRGTRVPVVSVLVVVNPLDQAILDVGEGMVVPTVYFHD
jgi:hypothetical protein